MSNYRRLISYIYAYEGGVKGKNIGYAKVEVRNGQCRIHVNVKKIFIGSNDTGVYLLAAQGEILLGRIFIRNGSGEFRITVSAENVEGSGCSMDECYGLTVHDVENTWQSYTTIWEDAVAHAAQIDLADVTSENVRREAAGQAERTEESEPAPVRLPVSEEIARELEREEKKQADVAPWENSLREKAPDEAPQEEQEIRENRESRSEPESQEDQESQSEPEGREDQESRSEPESYEDQESQNKPESYEDQESQSEPESYEDQESQSEPESQERQESRNKPESQENQEDQIESEIQKNQEIQSGPGEKRAGFAGEMPAAEMAEADRESGDVPEPGNTARLRELDRLEQEEASQNNLWNKLQRRYAKVLAFDCETGCEILSIKPQDIGLLPREIWVYGNNSFLLHGYYNYRHLILARLNNPNGAPRYLLGVPGHYFSNEKYMASMFGFPHFVLARKQPAEDGRFGYWYTDIRL